MWAVVKHGQFHDLLPATHLPLLAISTPQWIAGEEIQKGPEKISEEVIAENFPNMGKEIVNQVQKHKVSQEG